MDMKQKSVELPRFIHIRMVVAQGGGVNSSPLKFFQGGGMVT